jgi:hypothetical protein
MEYTAPWSPSIRVNEFRFEVTRYCNIPKQLVCATTTCSDTGMMNVSCLRAPRLVATSAKREIEMYTIVI